MDKFVVFDLRSKAKKVDKGWKRLYTYSHETSLGDIETCIVSYKQILSDEELKYYKKLKSMVRHILILTKQELIELVNKDKKSLESFGFTVKRYPIPKEDFE